MQWAGGCVRGELTYHIEERRKGELKFGRRETAMCVKAGGRVSQRSDAVEHGWINSVRGG